jgi:hypothetical protein
MDLRTLIPDSVTVSAPLNGILGDQSSGLTGIASRLESQDFAGMATSLGQLFQGELSNVLPAQGSSPFSGALGSLGSLATVTAPPDDLLTGVQRPLSQVEQMLVRLPQIIELLQSIVQDVEQARGGNLAPLVQRATEGLNLALQAASGPDLAGFEEWRRYLVELSNSLRPLIEAGGSQAEIRDRLLQLALNRIRDAILGIAPEASLLPAQATTVLNGLLPDVPGLGLTGLRDTVLLRLTALQTAAESNSPNLSTLIDDYQTALRALTDAIHRALDTLESTFNLPVLVPGRVSEIASRELERVQAVRVDDYSNVVERVESFFTQIETAIDQVDLSFITEPINQFFGQIQAFLGRINPATLEQELDRISAEANSLVSRLEELLITLTARIQGWFGEVTQQVDGVINQLGSTGADGRFHFAFETELNNFYQRLDTLIQGNPAQPSAFNLQRSLQNFQQTVTGFITDIETTLVDLMNQLTTVRDSLAANLTDVKTQIEQVNPAEVMNQAKTALEDAFQQIGDLEFDAVVDPVIAELDEARETLAQIDLSSLNDLLKAALKAALDTIRSANFDQEITQALLQEFDQLLQTPRQILQEIGTKVNELIAKIQDISPRALLVPIQAQIDRVIGALDLDLEQLLQPIVVAYRQVIEQVRQLDPTQFLTPVTDAFNQVTGVIDGLRPQTLLQPLQVQIDTLATTVQAIDVDRQLAPVNAVFGEMDRFLDSLNPAVLLQPLNQPFAALDRTLESLRPAVLLAPIVEIMNQISGFTSEVSQAVIDQIRALYDEATRRADSLDPTALFAAIGTPIRNFRDRFNQLQPAALLTAAQQTFTRVRTAVAAADSRNGTTFAQRLDTLAPTLAFGAVIGRSERVTNRLDAVLAGLDPAPLATRYQQARQRMDELLPRAIRDDITASRLQALLGLMDPARWIDRLNTIYQRILDKLHQISPALVIDPLTATYQTLRTALSGFNLGQITSRIEQVIGLIAELIQGISLEAIVAPLLSTVDRLKGVVRGLDPKPLIDALRTRFQNLLRLFEQFGPEAVIQTLQAAVDRLVARVQQLFDLDVILQPLLEIFDAISNLLGGLDAGELIGVLDDKLDKLRDELEEALVRTGNALQAMLAAVPLEGGAASAGVSLTGGT